MSVLCLTTACYYLHHWALLFKRDDDVAYLATVMCVGAGLIGNGIYAYGGTSDEYAMPAMSALGYYSYLLWKNKSLPVKQWIIAGLCIGLLFWNKYTLAVSACFLAGGALLLDRKIRENGKTVRAFAGVLLGFSIITAPILAYFAWHHAWRDLYYGYFQFHVLYHAPVNLLHHLTSALVQHPLPFFLMILSCGMMALRKSRYKYIYGGSCMIMLVCVYASASFQYYFLPLLPFCLYGLVRLQEHGSKAMLFWRLAAVSILLASSSTIYPNGYEHYSRKEILSRKSELEAIAAYCQQYEDRTLLHAGGFDSGYYILSGTKPTVPYYQHINCNPVGDAAQRDYIRKRRCAFALVRTTAPPEIFSLLKEYGYVPCELPEPPAGRCFLLFHYTDAK